MATSELLSIKSTDLFQLTDSDRLSIFLEFAIDLPCEFLGSNRARGSKVLGVVGEVDVCTFLSRFGVVGIVIDPYLSTSGADIC